MSEVQELYVALLGRPADPSGLDYFGSLSPDNDRSALIRLLTGETEYRDRFNGMDEAHGVNAIYNALLGRDGEATGLAFWLDQLKSGTVNTSNIAIAMFDAAKGADKTTIEAKLAAADLFNSHLDLPSEVRVYSGPLPAALGRAFINGVDASHPATEALVDRLISQLVSGEATSPKPSDTEMEAAKWHEPMSADGDMPGHASAGIVGFHLPEHGMPG